jgi:hypothetical protein
VDVELAEAGCRAAPDAVHVARGVLEGWAGWGRVGPGGWDEVGGDVPCWPGGWGLSQTACVGSE